MSFAEGDVGVGESRRLVELVDQSFNTQKSAEYCHGRFSRFVHPLLDRLTTIKCGVMMTSSRVPERAAQTAEVSCSEVGVKLLIARQATTVASLGLSEMAIEL